MNEQYLFLVNPAAQSGQALRIWQKIEEELKNQRVDYKVEISHRHGDLYQLALAWQQDQHDSRILVVVGGDGSLNEVVNGQLAANSTASKPLAYIPAGSGNDFARAHHLIHGENSKKVVQKLLETTERKQPTQLDIGHYLDKTDQTHCGYFVNNIGIGFDAATVAATNQSRSKRFFNRIGIGKVSYLFSILGVLQRQDTFEVEIFAGQRRLRLAKGYLLTISNHPYFGGGVEIMADADPTDGQLDLIGVEKMGGWPIIKLLGKVLKGSHYGQPGVNRLTAPSFNVRISSLELGQADGEELGAHVYNLVVTTQKHPFWLLKD